MTLFKKKKKKIQTNSKNKTIKAIKKWTNNAKTLNAIIKLALARIVHVIPHRNVAAVQRNAQMFTVK